jgi:hypothetical protein
MRKLLTLPLMLIALLVLACSHSPLAVSLESAAGLQAEDTTTLCWIVGFNGSGVNKARAELERRQALTEEEWQLVDQHKIRLGMSRCAVLASWGPPTDVKQQTNEYGLTQVVWRWQRRNGTAQFVYLENDAVASFAIHN